MTTFKEKKLEEFDKRNPHPGEKPTNVTEMEWIEVIEGYKNMGVEREFLSSALDEQAALLTEQKREFYQTSYDEGYRDGEIHFQAKVREVVESKRNENEESDDFMTGEHWSTFGYPKACDDILQDLEIADR